MPLYKFYSETEFVNLSEARKIGTEYFEYTEKHSFRKSEGVMYRTTDAVPSFQWNWLGLTRSFLTSIYIQLTKTQVITTRKKNTRFVLCYCLFLSDQEKT